MKPTVDVALARAQGLSAEEFALVEKALGRTPTFEELGVFAALWSEHCSYKSSRIHLRQLPTQAPFVVQGPGENAGIIDVGTDRVAFKIESHNHPSYIEPYQGAATGVGGILRDIFTMGARPIALFDSLRFGDPSSAKMRHLVGGVVSGISGYGNSVGVPTVGGECVFHPCYEGNILVNVLAVGVFEGRRPVKAISGESCELVYVGSRTGRDGIHGAVMASESFGSGNEARRPAVQVGDPFLEKLLIEACIEVIEAGLVHGLQDMGAAGLSCASSEMSFRGGVGGEVDLAAVPLRASGMTPYEILLSESQERMLIAVHPGNVPAVKEIFEKWDLEAAVIGRAREGERLIVRHGANEVASLPVGPLNSGAPLYDRPRKRPAREEELAHLDVSALDVPDLGEALLTVLGRPSVASKEWIWRQYDHEVQVNTLEGPGGDAAVLRLKHGGGALALSVDGNGRACFLNPYEGAKSSVAESFRNVACTGAIPMALTNCLNFGSPESPEVMWQFAEVVRGMADAAGALGTPVTGGNVSFYNETRGAPIHPTPVVGCLGFLSEPERRVETHFRQEGDVLLLLGGAAAPTLGGSEYLAAVHGKECGHPPRIDLAAERQLGELLAICAGRGLLHSAHDLSEGGVAAALAECCLGGFGAEVSLLGAGRPDVVLFGERGATVVVSVAPGSVPDVQMIGRECGVPVERLGRVGGDMLRLHVPAGEGSPAVQVAVEIGRILSAHSLGLPRALGEEG
jgi:phosphoribosylformylglycinamidine synthase